PNKEELQSFKEKLFNYMTLNPRVYNHFKEYATSNVHPMTALRTSVSYVAHFDEHAEDESEDQTMERAVRIQ
ncbi:citrate/2-methylcitrate synthase, partial [Staphylococcus aureus]